MGSARRFAGIGWSGTMRMSVPAQSKALFPIVPDGLRTLPDCKSCRPSGNRLRSHSVTSITRKPNSSIFGDFVFHRSGSPGALFALPGMDFFESNFGKPSHIGVTTLTVRLFGSLHTAKGVLDELVAYGRQA